LSDGKTIIFQGATLSKLSTVKNRAIGFIVYESHQALPSGLGGILLFSDFLS
tara:strand:- start:564 stop:719 length:156 start_codon:yes stop_codon:yes gene_type:complete